MYQCSCQESPQQKDHGPLSNSFSNVLNVDTALGIITTIQ